MIRFSHILPLSLFLAPALVNAGQTAPSPVAATDTGKVSGIRLEATAAFLGIPYAAPPTGENRWRAPQPAASWQGTRPAVKFGPSCPQAIVPGGFAPWVQEYVASGATSEDCLTLNVWKPDGPARNLPVLVWIHGGGFTSGSSSVPVYDGAALARQGIIVVSINYRLGFLGSLASPELRETTGGNFGLQDQIAALQWVKRNIAAFGGDPRRVTIAGQSAGAISVHYLMLAPSARGLFKQAIPQSGIGLGIGLDLALPSRERAEKDTGTFLAAAEAGSLAEARKLTLEQLNAAFRKVGGRPGAVDGIKVGPYADGRLLPLDPSAAFLAGHYNDTPVLIGLTADEGSGLNPNYRVSDPSRYEAILKQRFGTLDARAARIYPATPGRLSYSAVLRDGGIFAVDAWRRARSRTSRFPIYGYIWTHVEPGPGATKYGAFHTSEVPYVFATLDKSPDRPFQQDDRDLSRIASGYWVNFVKTGNPNGRDLPTWPLYSKEGDLLDLGGGFRPYPALDAATTELFRDHVEDGGSLLVM